ncbi:MAG TPA: VWA domain-containing protein [Acidimicrobiia bacterium]|nr:VWA domain-containing protein [Acidimicrobiia bacterium]
MNHPHGSRWRYSAWDGTQDPLADLESANRLADAFSDRLLDGMSAERAMRRLLDEGLPGRFGGLQQMRDRIRDLQERRRQQSRLGDALEEVSDQLDEVLATERATLAGREGTNARFQEAMLDNLPGDPAGRIRELQGYEFASEPAAAAFADLMEQLRQQMLDAYLGQVAEGVQNMSEEDMAALRDMIADLNRMLEQHQAGLGPSDDEFAEFMARHGRFFPENPQNLDELLEVLAQRAAAMSRFMASLSSEQRAQMQALAEELMGDMGLSFEVSRLNANLRGTMPQLGWDERVRLEGDRSLGMGEALAEIEALSELERLEDALYQDYAGASLEDIDGDDVARLLGDDAARDIEALKDIERLLQEAGMIARDAGRIELTPRGVRKLGERALITVFERLELDQAGSHEIGDAGGFGEPTGQTRPWRFGDPFRIDLQGTVTNAVLREGATTGRLQLAPDDFMLAEAEARTSTSTALLLDMSRSMPMRGHWEHARRMTFALHTLITSQFPEDRLHIVGFADYARVLRPTDLAAVEWEPTYGTNYEHAFLLAGRLLAKESSGARQVILVTDGEPTAHLVGDQVYFNWPPVRETIERSLREAKRLAQGGVTMNIFMLEDEPRLEHFIDRLAKLVRGRVFAVPDDDLGSFVVRDYVRGKGR